MNTISKSDSYAAAGVDITAGYKAVELLNQGFGNRVVVMRDGKITDLDIDEALSMERVFDMELYKVAMTVSI